MSGLQRVDRLAGARENQRRAHACKQEYYREQGQNLATPNSGGSEADGYRKSNRVTEH
jgi:hypothetical protein